MKTKTKIVIGGLVSFGLMAILAIVGIVSLWEYAGAKFRSPEIRKINDKGIADGIAFGKTTYKTAKQAKAAQLAMIKIAELVNLRLAQDDSRIEPLTEIGDAASLVTNRKNGATIYCQKGKTKFEIEVLDSKDKTVPIDVLKSIAKKVAGKF